MEIRCVRLYAAHGLLAGRDDEGLKTLIGLLTEPTPEWAWHSEELLRWVGGKSAPREVIGNPGEEGARRCRASWEKWLQNRPGRTDFRQLEGDLTRPGLQLWWIDLPLPPWKKEEGTIYHPKPPRICLFGFDGKLRHAFRITEASELIQTTPHGLITVGSVIREYNWGGKVVRTLSPPADFHPNQFWRLPSGMVFAFNPISISKLLPSGEEVPLMDMETFPFVAFKAWPLLSGEAAFLAGWPKGPDGIQLVDCEKGKRGRLLPLSDDITQGSHVGDFQVLPNGRLLLFLGGKVPGGPWSGKSDRFFLFNCLEVDWTGKKYAAMGFWFPGPLPFRRLPNGNFLVSRVRISEELWIWGPVEPGVVEVDRWGREVGEWPLPYPGSLFCALPCLNLVRLGFERPKSLTRGSNNIPEVIRGL